MASKLRALINELGFGNALLYSLGVLLQALSRRNGVFHYHLVAQPLPDKPLLPARRADAMAFREIAPGDPVLAAFPLTADKVAERYGQGSRCFAVFKEAVALGYLWICFDTYNEDEVRCRYRYGPAGTAVWDYDVYIFPEHRTGFALARLWQGVGQTLTEQGYHWSVSRISAFNMASLNSHRRLGAQRLGNLVFLVLGGVQIMMANRKPYIHLSLGKKSAPEIFLTVPS